MRRDNSRLRFGVGDGRKDLRVEAYECAERAELAYCVQVLVVNPMRALDLAIEVRCPWAYVDMANVQRLDVPMELRLKLRPAENRLSQFIPMRCQPCPNRPKRAEPRL